LLYQSDSLYSQVESLDAVNSQVTVRDTKAWTIGSVTKYASIETIIEWTPIHAGNAAALKHFREVTLVFKNNYFPVANIGFYSDLSGSLENTEVEGTYGGLWGLFPWGSGSWGGVQRQKLIRTYVPIEKSRCNQLQVRFTFKQGYSLFKLQGLSLQFDVVSERGTK
jgi:hypothetical protein